MSRRHQRRVSFARAVVPCALVSVVLFSVFSLVNFLTGMHRANDAPPPTSRRAKGDGYYERSPGDNSDEKDDEHSSSGHSQSEEERQREYDSPPSRFQKDAQPTEDKGDDTRQAAPPDTDNGLASPRRTIDAEDAPARGRTRFPRTISMEGDETTWNNHLRGEKSKGKRKIHVSSQARKEQERLLNSGDFRQRDPLYEGDCVPMQPWQETSFPNCNSIHELDFPGKLETQEFKYFARGGYNQIFWIDEEDKPEDSKLIIKILKWGTTYSDRNFDRVRRDGLILERLTHSPYVLDIYGFCGFAVLTPYANGGTLSDEVWSWSIGKKSRGKKKLSPETRLKWAAEIASGLADVHDIDGEGLSSVSHGDLKGGQYLFSDGAIKLGDFNRGRFLRRNATAPDTACPYTIGKNDAAFRSPEEYEYLPQTSAIDVWALGSILYQILTGNEAWHDTEIKKAQKNIMEGKLPDIDETILESRDPVDLALREAIDMCWIYDPKQRAKAADVARFLRKKHSELPEE